MSATTGRTNASTGPGPAEDLVALHHRAWTAHVARIQAAAEAHRLEGAES